MTIVAVIHTRVRSFAQQWFVLGHSVKPLGVCFSGTSA